jgi:protein-S-isoprenylcysteine O-methyltransferase Ste14/pimeloyl-ACP methyl ester carboxylesterase
MNTLIVAVAGLAALVALVTAFAWGFARLWCRPRRERTTSTPADEGLPFECVQFASHGVEIEGWFVPATSRSPSPPVVVLVHGWSTNAADMLPMARLLHRSGFATLLYDARGHGASGDDGPITILKLAEDVLACIDYLDTRSDVDLARLGVLGRSIGGGATILAAAREPRIRALVSCSAFADPQVLTRATMRRLHIPLWPFASLVRRFIERWLGTTMADVAPANRIGSLNIPLLLVHGESDRFIPATNLEILKGRARADRIEILRIRNRGHSDITRDPASGEKITTFFTRHLDRGPDPALDERPACTTGKPDHAQPKRRADPCCSDRYVAYALLGAAVALGGSALLLFAGFLFAGRLPLMDLGFGKTAALGWDAMLCLAFFAQHSGMIRQGFQRRLARLVAPHLHAALYALVSGAVLMALLVLWQASDGSLISLPGVLRWLLRGLFLVGVAGMVWGLRAVPFFDPFGLGQILAHLRGRTGPRPRLVAKGPYRFVRHPLYVSMLVLIWSCPEMPADRLLFNVLWTAWMVAGTLLEERDLVSQLGEAYRDYQRRVPMLLPRWPGATVLTRLGTGEAL